MFRSDHPTSLLRPRTETNRQCRGWARPKTTSPSPRIFRRSDSSSDSDPRRRQVADLIPVVRELLGNALTQGGINHPEIVDDERGARVDALEVLALMDRRDLILGASNQDEAVGPTAMRD